MTVVVTVNVEARYRGFLASAMLEIAPGVYTSPKMTSGIRERVWGVLTRWHDELGNGSIVMTWRDPAAVGEQRIRTLGGGSQDNCGCRRHIFGEALTAHIVSGRGVCPETDLGLTFAVVLQRPSAGKCFLRGSPRSRGDRPYFDPGVHVRMLPTVPPLARG